MLKWLRLKEEEKNNNIHNDVWKSTRKKIQAIAFNALTIKKNYKLILLVVGFVQRAYNFFAHQ